MGRNMVAVRGKSTDVLPCPNMLDSYNGHYAAFVPQTWGFDSSIQHQALLV